MNNTSEYLNDCRFFHKPKTLHARDLGNFSMLASTMGRAEVDWLCSEALSNREIFEFLFELVFLPDNERIAWHAAWVIEKVSKKAIENFENFHKDRLIDLILTNNHSGLKRLALSILFNLPLRQPISVELINGCFDSLISTKESVAIQVLSMKIIEKAGQIESEFSQELVFSLMNLDDELFSKGFIAAKKNILKRLETKNPKRD